MCGADLFDLDEDVLMLNSKELEIIIKGIGSAKACITGQTVAETKRIVLAKGLDAAELYATQPTGTDENTELSRVLEICRKNKLSPEAIAQLLDKLAVIESR